MKSFSAAFGFLLSIFCLFSCDSKRDLNGDLLFGVHLQDPASAASLNQISGTKNEDGNLIEYDLKLNYEIGKLVSYSDLNSGKTMVISFNSNQKIAAISGVGFLVEFLYSGGTLNQIITHSGGSVTTTNYSFKGTFPESSLSVKEENGKKIYKKTEYQFQAENISKITVKSGTLNSDGSLPQGDLPVETHYTYDNGTNPFKMIPKEFALYLAEKVSQNAEFLSANNITKSESSKKGTVAFTNTYNKNKQLIRSVSEVGFSTFIYK